MKKKLLALTLILICISWNVGEPMANKDVSYLTRIEMVRLMDKHSHLKKHPFAKGLCAQRFNDVSKKDQCAAERFFYVRAVYYDYYNGPAGQYRFGSHKPVNRADFQKAYRIAFNLEPPVIKSKFVPRRIALQSIQAAAKKGNKHLKKAAEIAYERSHKEFEKISKMIRKKVEELDQRLKQQMIIIVIE